jgi:glutamate dehydrogenase
MLNRMGSEFLIRLLEDSGDSLPDIARAYSAARELYAARGLWQEIDGLDNRVPAAVQIELHWISRGLLERASQWLLRNRRPPLAVEAVVAQFRPGIAALGAALPQLLAPAEQALFELGKQQLIERGVPAELARAVISQPVLYSALDIIEVATHAQLPVEDVASIYFALASQLEMNWLRESIINLPTANHWQRRARAALLNNLYDQGRSLTADVLKLPVAGPPQARLHAWLERNRQLIERCLGLFADLRAASQQPDLAMLSVALRETDNLAQGG